MSEDLPKDVSANKILYLDSMRDADWKALELNEGVSDEVKQQRLRHYKDWLQKQHPIFERSQGGALRVKFPVFLTDLTDEDLKALGLGQEISAHLRALAPDSREFFLDRAEWDNDKLFVATREYGLQQLSKAWLAKECQKSKPAGGVNAQADKIIVEAMSDGASTQLLRDMTDQDWKAINMREDITDHLQRLVDDPQEFVVMRDKSGKYMRDPSGEIYLLTRAYAVQQLAASAAAQGRSIQDGDGTEVTRKIEVPVAHKSDSRSAGGGGEGQGGRGGGGGGGAAGMSTSLAASAVSMYADCSACGKPAAHLKCPCLTGVCCVVCVCVCSFNM